MKIPHISILIPVYNCSFCLEDLYDRLVKSVKKIDENFEIIFINDCSPDNSWDIIEHLCNKDKRVRGIKLSRNFGQQISISAGFEFAKGDWIVVMDCDLQDPPEEINKLYSKTKEGYELVIGFSKFRGKKGFLRNTSRKIFFKLYNLFSDYPVPSHLGTNSMVFYICSRKIRNNLVRLKENNRYVSVLILSMGFKSTSLEVEHHERETGKSSYSFIKRLNLATIGLIIYSTALLRLVRYFGLIMSISSFITGFFIIILKITGNSFIPGWASTVCLVLFSLGTIVFVMGVLGIYIDKIFIEVKQRPLYYIDEELNTSK